jgi:hypothetical protein
MQTKRLDILKSFAAFFFLLGVIGWFLPFFGWPFGSWIESPNSEPHGIILDKYGNIYCGSKSYGRIQKYRPNGKYDRGVNTEGGTWQGSDFGFQINEKDQLCIVVSWISKDNKGSVHRLRIYDQQGNLLHTEKNESDKRDYIHDMKNSAVDSDGNIYNFQGFLFPRVVKQTQVGDRSIIISTPVLLWFVQAPFPAFAFFFVSMFILTFLGFKAKAAKLSISTIDLVVGGKKLPSVKKTIFVVFCIIAVAVILSIIVPIGFRTYPLLAIFSFVSLWIIMAIIFLLLFVSVIISQWRCAKLDFKAWKDSMFGSSLKTRYESGRYLRSFAERDPIIQKVSKLSSKIALFCLLTWFVILALAVCVVLYLDHIGVWHNLINKWFPEHN